MKIALCIIPFLFGVGFSWAEERPNGWILEDVSGKWMQPVVRSSDLESVALPMPNATLSKLQSIVIPKVNFNDMPLSRVLDTLSELSTQFDPDHVGINIVLIDPQGLNPHVSINLRQASLEKILNFISKSVHFAYDLHDDTLVFEYQPGSSLTLETAFFPVSRATVLRLTDLHTPKPVNSQSAQAKPNILAEEAALRTFLQKAGVDFDNTPGSNLAFEGTQLIVTHTSRNLERVRNILDRYKDIKQVEIEAKFLEVQAGLLEDMGLRWSVAARNNPTKNTHFQTGAADADNLRSLSGAFATQASSTSGSIIVSGSPAPIPITNPLPALPNTLNLASNATPLGNVMGVMGKVDLNVVLRALEQNSGAELMSAPKLTVLSGKTAQIIVAQEFRYPESFGDIGSDVGATNLNGGGSAGVSITAGTPRNFAVRNIGVEMEVTPTVEEDNNITLRLEPQVTEFEGFIEYGGNSVAVATGTIVNVPSGFAQPIFSTRRIQTEVTIFDGATVIMGGLTREEVKKVHDKVPFLGDIPFLGKLFQSHGETNQKRNLLIFITANRVSPQGSFSVQP